MLKAIDRLTLSKLGFDFEVNTSILKLLSFFIGQTIYIYYGTNSASKGLDSLKHLEYKLTDSNVPLSFFENMGPWTMHQDPTPICIDPPILKLAMDRNHYYHIYHAPCFVIDGDDSNVNNVN